MNRSIYLCSFIVPVFIFGIVFPEQIRSSIFWVFVIIYIPALSVWRMRYLQFTWMEVFRSFISFYGWKLKAKILLEK